MKRKKTDPRVDFMRTVVRKLKVAMKAVSKLDPQAYKWLRKCELQGSMQVETMRIGLRIIEFNLEFVYSISASHLPWVLIHEYLHVRLKHSDRSKEAYARIMQKARPMFELAADIEANQEVVKLMSKWSAKLPRNKHPELNPQWLLLPDNLNITLPKSATLYEMFSVFMSNAILGIKVERKSEDEGTPRHSGAAAGKQEGEL